MSTRSNIGIEYPDGNIHFVYCHYDGYLDYNGDVLNRCYTTPEQVESLISLGEISSLGASIDVTKDYHRWRGEPLNIQQTKNRDNVRQQEYAYVFSVQEGVWYAKGPEFDWMPLDEVLVKHRYVRMY